MVVLIGRVVVAVDTLLFERRVPPRVILPARVDTFAIGWWFAAAKHDIDGIASPPWVPRKPQFRACHADGRPQQIERMLREGLRFLDPGALITLQAFDAFSSVIQHALKDDPSVAGRFDAVVEHAKAVGLAEPVLCEFGFD